MDKYIRVLLFAVILFILLTSSCILKNYWEIKNDCSQQSFFISQSLKSGIYGKYIKVVFIN